MPKKGPCRLEHQGQPMSRKKNDDYWELRVQRYSYMVGYPLLAIARFYALVLPWIREKISEYDKTGSLQSIAVISAISTGTINFILAHLWAAHIIKSRLTFVSFIGFCFTGFLLGILTLRFLYEANQSK